MARQMMTGGFCSFLNSIFGVWVIGVGLLLTAATDASPARAAGRAEYQQPPQSKEAEELQRKIEEMVRQNQEKAAREAAERGAAPATQETQPGSSPDSATLPPAPGGTQPQTPVQSPRDRALSPPPPEVDDEARPASRPPRPARRELVGPPAYLKQPTIRLEEAATAPPPADAAQPTLTADETPVAQPVNYRDGANEWFNFEGMPWEDVVRIFAERLDKPLVDPAGDLVIGGELTYKNPRRFTLAEAIDELNFLMQEVGYRFVETPEHIRVLPLSEMPMHVPVAHTFPSRPAFESRASDLRRMDYVTVYFRVPDRDAKQIESIFGGALPDYSRMSVIGDTNQIKLTALVHDVQKLFSLVDMISIEAKDPRELRVFDIKTNAAEIERMVRDMMEIGQSPLRQPQFQRDPRTGQVTRVDQTGGAPEPNILISADERTNTLLVKATRDKLVEIESLIKELDKKPDLGKFETKVIPIEHAVATEVRDVLNDIFRQEQGEDQTPAWQRMQQLQRNRAIRQPARQQPNQPATPESVLVEGIFERAKKTVRIAAEERSNSLIVYANEEGQKRVQDMLEIIDVPVPSNFRTVKIENVEAIRIFPTIEQIAQGLGASGAAGRRGQAAARVVLDESNNAIHVVADRENMQKITEIIGQLDAPLDELVQHTVMLKNLIPSRAAEIVNAALTNASGGGRITPGRGPRAMRSGVSQAGNAQVLALDEAGILIVTCTDADWAKVEPTLRLWDESAVSDSPVVQAYSIASGDAQTIAGLLDGFYRNYQHPRLGRSTVAVAAEGNTIYVQAILPAQEEIASMIQMLDIEDANQIEVLPLQHADAQVVAEQCQALFGGSGGGRRGGFRGAAPSGSSTVIEAEPTTNSLIVRADATTLSKVKDFALERDLAAGSQRPERKFYVLEFAKPRDVAATLTALFGGAGSRGARTARGAAGGGASQVTVIESENQVIVEAPAEKHPEIARVIEQLDSPEGRELVTTLVRMPGAQVQSIAARLDQAFRDRVQRQGKVARFEPDATTETILVTVTNDLQPEVDGLIAQYKELTSELVFQQVFRKLEFAQAAEAAQWLQPQLVASMTQVLGSNAARQVQVAPDPRTNRLFIYAPQVAIKQAELLLDQYDVNVDNPAPAEPLYTDARKLAGLDVRNVAAQLTQFFGGRPQRPDRLRASFNADELTEILLISVPKDWKPEVDQIIAQFEAETVAVAPQQQQFVLENADATWVAQKLNEVLLPQIRSKRGRGMADRVQISVDDRLNRVLVNAPAAVMEDFAAQIEQLDLPPTVNDQLRTIALKHADAGQAFQILQNVFRDKIQRQKTLSINADATRNVIIVKGNQRDYNEIAAWLKEYDEGIPDMPTVMIELKYADPNELANMINQLYGAGQRNQARRSAQTTQVIVANNNLLVRAPQAQLEEIERLVARIDTEDSSGFDVKIYELKVLDAPTVAGQVNLFLASIGQVAKRGQLKPFAFGEPATNSLLVIAPKEHATMVAGLIQQFESKELPISQSRQYPLKFVRADQVQASVDAMLQAKVLEKEGARKQKTPVKVLAEPVSNRLFVYAPDEYQNLAAELIRMLDEDIETGEIVQIVRLERGDATQMALTLNQMLGGAARGRPGTATQVLVTADAGSNSIILKGLPKDVAEIQKYVGDLETNSELVPELRVFSLEYAATTTVVETLTGLFPGTARNPNDSVTITEDEYYNRLIVTANKRKMAQIAAVIDELDKTPASSADPFTDERGREIHFVDIYRGDAYDIAYEVRSIFPPDDKGGPKIESDWDGRYIKVVCRKGEFDRIEAAIREFESRAKFENKVVIRTFRGDQDQILRYLQSRIDGLQIQRTPAPEKVESIVERLRDDDDEMPKKPRERRGANARPVTPQAAPNAPRAAGLLRASITLLDAAAVDRLAALASTAVRPFVREDARAPDASPMFRFAAYTPEDPPTQPVAPQAADAPARATTPAAATPARSAAGRRREPAQIVVQPDGSVLIVGPKEAVEEVEDAIDLLEEDLAVGEVIRIFEFKYGDVNAAAEVLNIMFNDRQVVRLPQPQQQQQPQRGQQGQDGQQGGRGQQNMLDQLRGMIGGAQPQEQRGRRGAAAAGGQRIRIATDSDHNYLIIKCDQSDLPEIRQLLRELDIPPDEVSVKVFQLVNLNAEETANNIREVLGISKAQSRRGAAAPQQRGGGAAQQQLLQMLQQEVMTIPGFEGTARIEKVEIVANRVTNSVLVSAPTDVLEIVKNVIDELEGLEGRNIVGIYAYKLEAAKVDDILPLLQDIFTAAAVGRGATPASMGPVTISGDPRNDTIIFTAEAKDVEKVRSQIAKLDIGGAITEAETYVCQWGDAAAIVDMVSSIYPTTPAGRGRGGASTTGGDTQQIRIAAEPGTNSITVWGPVDKRAVILAKIVEIDELNQRAFREIDLLYADAEVVADQMMSVFGGAARGRRGEAGAAAGGRVMILGDKKAKKLLVRAPDTVFAEIESLVPKIDVPSEQLQIRNFALRYADAVAVVAQVEEAFKKYIALLPRSADGRPPFDAFTAMPDPRTNSITVVGSQEIFLFVDNVLKQIDVQTPVDTIKVERAKASQVANFVRQFLMPAGGDASGDRGRGAPAARLGPTLIPNDNNNTIVVRGSKADIDQVRDLVARFDNPDLVSNTVKVIKVPLGQDASRLASEVERIVNDSELQAAELTGAMPRRVIIGSDAFTNTIIAASADQSVFGMVETIVQQLAAIRDDTQVTRIIQLTNLSSSDAQQVIDQLQNRRTGAGGGFQGGGNFRRFNQGGAAPQQPAPRRRAIGGGAGASVVPRSHEFRGASNAWLQPYVGTGPLAPYLAGFLFEPYQEQPPPEASPARPRSDERSQRAFGVDRLMQEDAAAADSGAQETQPAGGGRPIAPQAQAPQPPPVAGLSGISGNLQGQVVAQPVDSKRIIITGDKRDVEFIEQLLALMEQSAPRPQIEIFTLRNAKATTLQQVITTTMQQYIDSGTRTPGPEDRFSVNAEARSNSLIVSAADRNMAIIAELITNLDVDVMGEGTDFRTVPLEHVRAAEVVAQLTPTIEKLNRLREVPADMQASIQALPSANSVLIIGTGKDIEEITRLVQVVDIATDLEKPGAAFTTADVILIPLQNGDAEQVAQMLQALIDEQQNLAREAVTAQQGRVAAPYVRRLRLKLADGRELPELDLEKPIKILPEKGTNSLIVFSSKDNVGALQAIVGVFDALPSGEETDVRAFVLRHAAAEPIATLLKAVFDDGKKALQRPSNSTATTFEKGVLPPVPPGLAGKGLPYNIAITHDARSNTIVVVGRKDAVLLAAGLVTELDRPTAQLGVEAYVLTLRNFAASAMAERLNELMEKRTQALSAAENTARDSAVIIPDDRSNALIVLATREMYDMLERLAIELDTAPSYRVVDMRFRRLNFADAAKLQAMLQDLFDKKKEADPSSEPKDTLHVIADARSNSLMLTGTRDFLEEAAGLIDQLDREFAPSAEFRVFAVQLNSASNVASLLQQMVQQSRTGQGDAQGTPVHIAADPVLNNILVAAAHEDMLQIDRWIQLLDKPPEFGRKTVVIPIPRGSAEEIAQRTQELFRQQGAGGQGGGQVDLTVTHDAATNAVVAVGPPALLKDIEAFVRQLMTIDPAAGTVVRIFRLEQSDAQSAGDLLTSVLQLRAGSVGSTRGGTGGGATGTARQDAARQVMLIYQRRHPELGRETLKAMREDVTVISDIRTNSLVVMAPPESMPLMESLIEAIDVPPRADKIRVFALRNADAEQMVEMLEQLFGTTGTGRARGGTTGGAGATTGEAERQLVFAGEAGGGQQEVTFTTDARTNSVIAAGTAGYLNLVEELILELDTKPIEDRKTIVYAPRNIVAAQLAASIRDYSEAEQQRLQSLGEDISMQRKQERAIIAIDNEDANRVIVQYSPRFESEVFDIVRELDQPPPQVSIEVLIIEVTIDNRLELGVEFAFQDLQFAKAGPSDTTTFDFVGGTDIGASGSGLGGFTFTISGADFNFLIRTLQTEGRIQVLSRPHIVAMDNQEAQIQVIDDVPYVSGTSTSIAGQVTTQVARAEVGIILNVTPQINPDGFVRLQIRQEVSDQSGSTIAVGPGVTAPVFFRRIADTTITVRDNETVVLGGLITQRKENNETKVPLVGDLPILGTLFRTQNDTERKTELLVVLTPRVIRTVEDYRETSIAQRDATGILPGEILTSPLMRSLRVKPEEVVPKDIDGPLGPFNLTPVAPDDEPEDGYGPVIPASRKAANAPDDGYDVPIPAHHRTPTK